MKMEDVLTETPYLHPGELSRKFLDGGVSREAIARDYSEIGSVSDLPVFLDHSHTHAIVFDPSVETSTGRLLQVFRVTFKKTHTLKFAHAFKNILQIAKVAIDKSYGSQGTAQAVYQILVDRGFTIISDDTQFEPAQALWKRLASAPMYKVYVADVEHGVFKDDDGNEIIYNSKNIPDQDIWSIGSDYSGEYRVLILTK